MFDYKKVKKAHEQRTKYWSWSSPAEALGGVMGLAVTMKYVAIKAATATMQYTQVTVTMSFGVVTMEGESTLANASPMGLLIDAIILAMARSFSPNHVAAMRVGHVRMATLAYPHINIEINDNASLD